MSIAKRISLLVAPSLLLMIALASLLFGALFTWQIIRGVVASLNETLCELCWRLTP